MNNNFPKIDRVIYLKDAIDNSNNLLKIGCTGNESRRNSTFKSSGNLSSPYKNLKGDFIDELAIQLYFRDYLYKRSNSKEIFYISKNIINSFVNLDIKEVYRNIWENREKIFTVNDIINKYSKKHSILIRSIEEVKPSINDIDINNSRLDLFIYKLI